MKRVDLSHASQQDLTEIAHWTEEHWGPSQKQDYLAQIETVLRSLGDMPEIGRLRDDVRPGLRSVPAGRHVVFYRLTADSVTVVRVLHERMNAFHHVDGDAGPVTGV